MNLSHSTLLNLIRPLTSVCLQNGIKLQELLPSLKKAFVVEAKGLLAANKVIPTVSKLSLMTGLQRPDITRYQDEAPPAPKPSTISQIVSLWINSSRFLNRKGQPRVLSSEGRDSEFARLVAAVSKEVCPYAVLFEMERAGIINRTDDGVQIVGSTHLVSKNKEEGLRLLGYDMNDLSRAVSENLESGESRHLHLRLAYDNIPPENLSEIKHSLLELGQRFIVEAQKIVAKYDRDTVSSDKIGAESENKCARIALTVFSYAQETSQNEK